MSSRKRVEKLITPHSTKIEKCRVIKIRLLENSIEQSVRICVRNKVCVSNLLHA